MYALTYNGYLAHIDKNRLLKFTEISEFFGNKKLIYFKFLEKYVEFFNFSFTKNSKYCCISAGHKKRSYLILMDITSPDKFQLLDIYKQKNIVKGSN